MALIEERITDLITSTVTTNGYELVRVRITGAKEKVLEIMAERADKTMSAEDCATLSRALSPVLDEADPIDGHYRLEVSSPGIDRPLTRLAHFHDWQGYEAKIELDRLVEGRKRFRGILGGVDGNNIVLDIEGEEDAALIPHDWVISAKLILTDALVRESLKVAKDAEKQAATGAAKETLDEYSGDNP